MLARSSRRIPIACGAVLCSALAPALLASPNTHALSAPASFTSGSRAACKKPHVVLSRNNNFVTFAPQPGIVALLVQVQSSTGVVLYDSGWASGKHAVTWQAMDDQGASLPSGVYSLQIIVRDTKGIFCLEQSNLQLARGSLQLAVIPALSAKGTAATQRANSALPLQLRTAGLYHSGIYNLAPVSSLQVKGMNHGIPGTDPLPGSNPVTGPPIIGQIDNSKSLIGQSDSGVGVQGQSNSGVAVYGQSNTGDGVQGHSGDSHHSGVAGINPSGDGVHGDSGGGVGVDGSTITGIGVKASSESGTGVSATSNGGTAINGVTSGRGYGVFGLTRGAGIGIYGQSTDGDGIQGVSSSKSHSGVSGSDGSGVGVSGSSTFGYGVHGTSSSADGVHGESHSSTNSGVGGYNTGTGMGVWGGSDAGYGVLGYGSNNGKTSFSTYGHAFNQGYSGAAVYGNSANHNKYLAGFFDGDVTISGNLTAANKSFEIDDPIDPKHKYLLHNCVESPDMMNIYNGNVTTDAKGYATVELPQYFSALNKDFRYQLTVIGSFARAIVSQEVQNNRFVIRTDAPRAKVSWQVTGVRHDPWAQDNRNSGEVPKTGAADGHYLYPAGYHQPAGPGMGPLIATAPPVPQLKSAMSQRVTQVQR